MLIERDFKVINMISFDFLELLSKEKGWNNYFYEIFKLLCETEYIYNEEYKYLNLNMVVLDQIVAYMKCINKDRVMIIENDIFLVDSDKVKYIAFCTCIRDKNQEHIVRGLFKRACECLLVNKIDYKLTNDEIKISDKDINRHYKINYVIKLLS